MWVRHEKLSLMCAEIDSGPKVSGQFQFTHSNFNLFTAISIYSRQFQFAHSNFNLLTAISICSRQFQFFHGNAHSIFRFTHYLSTMAADSSYQTSKHKIESRYLKSIFLTAPRKLYKLYLTIFIYCTASQNDAIPHINLSIEAKVLFTDVIGSTVFLFLPRKSKNGGAIWRNMLFIDPVWGSFFIELFWKN